MIWRITIANNMSKQQVKFQTANSAIEVVEVDTIELPAFLEAVYAAGGSVLDVWRAI